MKTFFVNWELLEAPKLQESPGTFFLKSTHSVTNPLYLDKFIWMQQTLADLSMMCLLGKHKSVNNKNGQLLHLKLITYFIKNSVNFQHLKASLWRFYAETNAANITTISSHTPPSVGEDLTMLQHSSILRLIILCFGSVANVLVNQIAQYKF